MDYIPLILNIFAGLGLLTYWLIAFVILYHLSRFGIGTQPKKFAAAFMFGSVVLSATSIVLYTRTDIASLLSLLPL